ncbi:MAG TPA: GTP 3',8-cyclase MoaA, partial [Candidatus Thermoplasmatota archaeon]
VDGLLAYVGAHAGLELQLIQFMPEMAFRAATGIDVQAVHERLSMMASQTEQREMHHRRRYQIKSAWVELVDPVGNADFCQHCHRVRVTADGHLKGCINVNTNLVATRGLDKDGIRRAFEQVVSTRAPFYGPRMPIAKSVVR